MADPDGARTGDPDRGRRAAGNLTADGNTPGTYYNYQWDAEGRLTKVLSGSTAISTDTYNALGQRVRDVTSSTTTDEAYDPSGALLWRNAGGASQYGTRAFVPLSGRILAEYGLNWTLFHHPDGLGSTAMVSDFTGNNFEGYLFYPWGELWNTRTSGLNGNPQEVFGQLQDYDSEFNAYNTPNRHQSPLKSRWLNPDPAGLGAVDLTNPQTLNRYAYVLNNPTTLIDPSGLDPCDQPGENQDAQCVNVYGDPSNSNVPRFLMEGYNCGYGPPQQSGYPYGSPGGNSGGSGQCYYVLVNPCGPPPANKPSAPGNVIRMPLPPNALSCGTSTGVNFNAPPGFSVSSIAANGQTNGLLGAGAAVGQGGYYDFQRVQVGATTLFYPGYTPVANVAVGAYLQGAGAPRWLGSLISNTYAFFHSSNGATPQQAQFRNLGYDLASGEATYSCQSHP